MTFLDADDEFTGDFIPILESMQDNVVQVITRVWDEQNECERQTDNVFLHGKFYRRDWWVSHGIHFPNVCTNEDVGIYMLVNGILYTEDTARNMTQSVEQTTYLYKRNQDSITRSNPTYNLDSIPDFLTATCGMLMGRSDIDIVWRQRQMAKAIAICRQTDDGRYKNLIAETEKRIDILRR